LTQNNVEKKEAYRKVYPIDENDFIVSPTKNRISTNDVLEKT